MKKRKKKRSRSNATTAAIMMILFFIIAIIWKWLSLNFAWAASSANLAYRRHELELEYIQNFNALRLQMFEISIYVLLFIALSFCALLAVIFYRKQRDSELRARDGLYPLVKNIVDGAVIYANPNTMIPAQWIAGDTPYGDAPYDDMQYSETQYQMSSTVALLNAIGPNGVRSASQAKLLAGSYRPNGGRRKHAQASALPHQPEKLLVEETHSTRLLTFREALEQSTSDAWILGQNEENGELAYFCPRTDVHSAIVGATGCGKSESSGLMMVLHALLQGYHVILLDGKGGLDWRSIEQYVEWQDMDHTLLPQQISALERLFQERMALLKTEQVATIYELERPLQPILALFEEFGATYDSLQVADKQQAKRVAVQMSTMFRLARSTGISFMVIDQAPNMWPKQVRANIKCAICYRLTGGLGQMFNEYNLHKLPKVGYFSLESQPFKAWHTKAELTQLQVELPPLNQRLL